MENEVSAVSKSRSADQCGTDFINSSVEPVRSVKFVSKLNRLVTDAGHLPAIVDQCAGIRRVSDAKDP